MCEYNIKKIIKIIVACDFSEYSKEALKYAAKLPEDFKIDLILIHLISVHPEVRIFVQDQASGP